MYGVLSILLLRVFSDTARKQQNVIRLVLIICIAFGMTNELIQGFVPGRFAGLLDVGLNVIGAVAGLLCGRLFIHKFGQQQN
jgi:VanZ family protein